MHGTVTAPTTKQRLAYGKLLRIWGKMQIAVPMRFAGLADAYEASIFLLHLHESYLQRPTHGPHRKIADSTSLTLTISVTR